MLIVVVIVAVLAFANWRLIESLGVLAALVTFAVLSVVGLTLLAENPEALVELFVVGLFAAPFVWAFRRDARLERVKEEQRREERYAAYVAAHKDAKNI